MNSSVSSKLEQRRPCMKIAPFCIRFSTAPTMQLTKKEQHVHKPSTKSQNEYLLPRHNSMTSPRWRPSSCPATCKIIIDEARATTYFFCVHVPYMICAYKMAWRSCISVKDMRPKSASYGPRLVSVSYDKWVDGSDRTTCLGCVLL